jgi:hypothetical protein
MSKPGGSKVLRRPGYGVGTVQTGTTLAASNHFEAKPILPGTLKSIAPLCYDRVSEVDFSQDWYKTVEIVFSL